MLQRVLQGSPQQPRAPPPFAAITPSAGSNGSNKGDNLWGWWQRQQQQPHKQPQQQQQHQTDGAVTDTVEPTSSSTESSALSSDDHATPTPTALEAATSSSSSQPETEQQLSERRASHAAASSSGRGGSGQQQPTWQHRYGVGAGAGGGAARRPASERLAALRLRRQQQREERQQSQQQQQPSVATRQQEVTASDTTTSDGSDSGTAAAGAAATTVSSDAAEVHQQQQHQNHSVRVRQRPLQQQQHAVPRWRQQQQRSGVGGELSSHALSSESLTADSDVEPDGTTSGEGVREAAVSAGASRAASVPGSNEAAWGSASDVSSHGGGNNTAALTSDDGADGATTTLTATADEADGGEGHHGGATGASTYSSSETWGHESAGGAMPQPVSAVDGSTLPPPLSTAAAPQGQQQQVRAANLLSAAQGWLSRNCRAAGSAVVHTLGRQLSAGLHAVSDRLSLRVSLPPPALHRVVVSQGHLDVEVWGEPLPRCVRDVGVLVTLGPNYSWLEVQVEGDAAPRHPASVKCTSINPAAKRHLRHVTPGSSSSNTRLRKFSCDVLPPAPPQPEQSIVVHQGVLAVEGGGAHVAAGSEGVGDASGLAAVAPSAAVAEAAGSEAGQDRIEGSSSGSGQQDSKGADGDTAVSRVTEVGPSVSPLPAVEHTDSGAVDAGPTNNSSSDSGDSTLPLSPLSLPSGQLGVTQSINFLLPEELQQQGAAASTALLPQKGLCVFGGGGAGWGCRVGSGAVDPGQGSLVRRSTCCQLCSTTPVCFH